LRQAHEVLKEFLELQVEQNVVMIDLTEAHLHTAECLATYVKHNENPRADPVSVDHSARRLTDAQKDEHKTHVKFKENQKKLAVLIGNLDALGDLERVRV